MLILDSFSAHQTPAVKYQHCASGDPRRVHQRIQPLDVSLNQPFKSYVRCYWSDWIPEQPVSLQSKHKLKPPGKELVARWISCASEEMQEKPDKVVWAF